MTKNKEGSFVCFSFVVDTINYKCCIARFCGFFISLTRNTWKIELISIFITIFIHSYTRTHTRTYRRHIICSSEHNKKIQEKYVAKAYILLFYLFSKKEREHQMFCFYVCINYIKLQQQQCFLYNKYIWQQCNFLVQNV